MTVLGSYIIILFYPKCSSGIHNETKISKENNNSEFYSIYCIQGWVKNRYTVVSMENNLIINK